MVRTVGSYWIETVGNCLLFPGIVKVYPYQGKVQTVQAGEDGLLQVSTNNSTLFQRNLAVQFVSRYSLPFLFPQLSPLNSLCLT